MFTTSVILTHLSYNRAIYRDWALAGGVTPTSAQFRVRGPKDNDGIARQFVVSINPNLALERDQISVTPVSYNDFIPEEHFFKKVALSSLTPLKQYYYGIVRPQRTPNSATMAGDVGTFTTPASEGERMNFTIATGSCALTGSQSEMFANILDLNPLMFIHMGDFHYEDLNTFDIDQRLEAYDKVMGSPSQRILYMRTIFTYMWDDHDWLGNNEDAEYEQAAAIAKKGYSMAIPHYPLQAVEAGTALDDETAAKYQAFSIGTVRFVITDLRSESDKSSEDFPGKVYSDDQKEWFFNELSQASDYDFIVWVTTRPWTNPESIGGDSWGGFVPDRDELSSHIASTIGAGPRNLLVLSGDNHMVAFDDGSSTDYSGQNEYPGGFPIFHSGPLTNFGSGLKSFFKRSSKYFTEGCMAINSEVNHQFSTVGFDFPSRAEMEMGAKPCVNLNSYAENSSNIIFSKRLCAGNMMREGTAEKDTCILQKLSVPTQSIFIAGIAVIVLNGLMALWYLGLERCFLALSYFGIGLLYYILTGMAAVAGAFCFGTLGVNVFAISIFTLSQAVLGSLFVGMAIYGHYTSSKAHAKSMDEEEKEDSTNEDENNAKWDEGVEEFALADVPDEDPKTKEGKTKNVGDSFSIYSM